MGSTEDQHHSHKRIMLIALVIVSSALTAIIFSLLFLWIFHRTYSAKSHNTNNAQSSDTEKGDKKKRCVSRMEYKVLEQGTNNFAETNVLCNGIGCVYYKAQLNDQNFLLTVKKLQCGAVRDLADEFLNEVDLLSKIHKHPNIISLLSCSVNGEERFIVYEFMQNGSLDSQLHGPSNGSALTWHMRMKIALDTARGLEYLHEHCSPTIIHTDLKSSNILLDSNFNAKLSDFGLAVIDGGRSKHNIKLSGTTLGHVAPEFLLNGKLTEKSDVYAFGILLLELLLERKAVEKLCPPQTRSIVTWVVPQLTDRTMLPTIIDPMIRNTMDLKHLYQVAAVAVLCVQPEPSYRPLITDVLHSLIPLCSA